MIGDFEVNELKAWATAHTGEFPVTCAQILTALASIEEACADANATRNLNVAFAQTIEVYARREGRLTKALRMVAQNDRSAPYANEEPRPSDGLTTQQAGVLGPRWLTPREIAEVFLGLLLTDPALKLPEVEG